MRTFALAAICLVGCSDPAADHALKRMTRKEKIEQAASQPPKRSVYRFEDGQLVVLDVPTLSGGQLDSQKCFVWRDAEFKSASLQCPSDLPGDFGNVGPEPEKNQP